MTKFFPNQKPDEQVLYAIRRHWVSYLPHLIFGGAVFTAFVVFLVFAIPRLADFSMIAIEGATIFVSIILLSTLFVMLFGFVDHYLDLLIITNERLIDIKQYGFFKQETKEIHLLDIENVLAQVEGALGVYLKFGHLIIQTGQEENEHITIKSIPQASKVARAIMELHSNNISNPNELASIRDQGIEDFGLGGKMDAENSDSKPEHIERDKSLSSYWAKIEHK